TASTDGKQRVGAASLLRDLADPVSRHLRPAAGRIDAEVEPRPALARDQEGPADAKLFKECGQLGQRTANDQTRRSRANSTNASAARVGVRPPARTSEISRAGSRPST